MSEREPKKYRFETEQIHAGLQSKKDRNARALPIYMTSSYLFDNAEHAANLFSQKEEGYTYSRQKNPTCEVFEKRMATLEGGTAAVATASGMSALMLVFTALAGIGNNIVASSRLYGGTTIQLKYSLKKLGIEVRLIDSDDIDAYKKNIDTNTRCLFVETIGNPDVSVPDFEGLSALAKECGIPFVIDNTFGGGGYLFRPIDWGADVVVHSATKWIGGHGAALAGVLVDAGTFNWKSDKFPNFSKPSPMLRNIVLADVYGGTTSAGGTGAAAADSKNTVLARYLRLESLKHFGPTLSPFNAFLIVLGLETLSLRMSRHCENALKLAQHLEKHSQVAWISFPGLPSHPSHKNAKKYFREGLYGSVFSFGLRGGEEAGKRFVESVQLASHLANVGDAKTLAIHPASTTHNQLNEEELRSTGISPDLIRVSVGIEHIDDIIEDFDQALANVTV